MGIGTNKSQFIIKYIANIITGSRIIFSLPLLFIPLSSACFYVFYLFCGFTDMIDGTIARKTGAVSKLGAKLDTIADFVFFTARHMKRCDGKNNPFPSKLCDLIKWQNEISIRSIYRQFIRLINKRIFVKI